MWCATCIYSNIQFFFQCYNIACSKWNWSLNLKSFNEFCRTKREKSHVMSRTHCISTNGTYVGDYLYTRMCIEIWIWICIHVSVYSYICRKLDLVCCLLMQKLMLFFPNQILILKHVTFCVIYDMFHKIFSIL